MSDWLTGALLGTAVGACIGSFVGTVGLRAPEDWRGVLTGRSACPSCGSRLSAIDLVPIASWALLGRRCRHCGAPIAAYYPLVELTAAGIGAVAGATFDPWLGVLGWWLLALALIDLRAGLLPDVLTLPLIVLGLVLRPDTAHLIGAVGGYAALWLVRAIYFSLRGREGLGLGDAKLLAAGGAWLGWQALPWVLLVGATGTLVAVVLVRRNLVGGSALPFGPGLATAVWLTAVTAGG